MAQHASPAVSAARDLAATIAERDAADSDTYPQQNVADLYDAGIVGAPFSADHGGSGATLADAVRITETVAAASPSTALIIAMPLGLAGAYSCLDNVEPPEHRASWRAQVEHAAAEFRAGRLARLLADSFAGTALRPPLPLGLDMLVSQFGDAETQGHPRSEDVTIRAIVPFPTIKTARRRRALTVNCQL